jgi:DNA-binding response OmpR family regulator
MIAVNVGVSRMDGFELYNEIKERDNQVRILLLSAPVEILMKYLGRYILAMKRIALLGNQYGKADY